MHLEIEGLWNARDVGLSTGALPAGRLFRSGSLHRVTPEGWSALLAAGVRSVVDLRTAQERDAGPTNPPDTVGVVVPELEDGLEQTEAFRGWFDDGRIGTPLYYGPFTEQWPERVERAVAAVAASGAGVLVHCARGRDRTGMVVALLLEGVGVPREAIARDFCRSEERARSPRARALRVPDQARAIASALARDGNTLDAVLSAYLDAHGGPRPELAWLR